MARAVYSTRFLAISTSSNATEDYEVGEGLVAVVKNVTAFIGGSGTSALQVYLTSPQCLLVSANGSTEGGDIVNWEGSQVLNAGETLEALILTDSFASLIASGYLLTM